ncbi:MAG: hypothetical protein ACRDRX_07790 [Pseudonocardiaceae bacterium]
MAAAVRDDELTPEQRECLAGLLHSIALASVVADCYPESATTAVGCLIATWAPVWRNYAELAAVRCGDGEHAA